jgi:hypothetical protein
MLVYRAVHYSILSSLIALGVYSSAALAQQKTEAEAELGALTAQLDKGRASPSDEFKELVSQIKAVLATVQGEILSKKLPQLKNAQLNLQTSIKSEGSAGVLLFIIEIGETISNETAQSLKITLSKPEPTEDKATILKNAAYTVNFSKDFGNAIHKRG